MNIRNVKIETNPLLQSRQTNGAAGLNTTNTPREGMTGTNRTDRFMLSTGTQNNRTGIATLAQTERGTATGFLAKAGMAGTAAAARTNDTTAGLNTNLTAAAAADRGTGLLTGTAIMRNQGLGGTAQGGVLTTAGLAVNNQTGMLAGLGKGTNPLVGGLMEMATINKVTGNQGMAAGPLGTVTIERNDTTQTLNRQTQSTVETTPANPTMTANRTQYGNIRPRAVELAGQTANMTVEDQRNQTRTRNAAAMTGNTGNEAPTAPGGTPPNNQYIANTAETGRNTPITDNTARTAAETVTGQDNGNMARADAAKVKNEAAVRTLQRQVERTVTQAQTQNPVLDLIG